MSTPRFDIFETYAQEHNSRILKASDDARLLRSLFRKSQAESKRPSIMASRSRLEGILASLILILRHQLA